jgi:hypothetical protein
LNSDVIISIPKLKTHEKVGLTCNLKGFVGIVGQKDCLAHHRFGGPEIDGDEYPAGTHFRHALSRFHDWVQGRDRMAASFGALEVADRLVRRGLSCLGATQAGAWHGNDTAWRMAIDLARIASYADREGRMRETPQRGNLALVDGIIGGQGDGPLSPDPVRSGVVLFGDNVAAVDWAACRLIGFAPQAVPLVREAGRGMRYPLLGAQPGDWPVLFNGAETVAGRIPRVSARPFSAPRGWRGHIEEG